MNRKTLLDGLHEVAENHLDFKGELREDTALVEALQLDSIRMMTLVVELENRFEVCLEDGDEVGLERVDQLLDLLERRLQ